MPARRPHTPADTHTTPLDGPLASTGTVTRLVPERGFGFIRGDDGRDYFFHASELINCEIGQLSTGAGNHHATLVSFEGTRTPKGLRASAIEALPG